MLLPESLLLLVVGASSTVARSVVVERDDSHSGVVQVNAPPLVSSVIPALTTTEITVTEAGKHTLGVDCPDLGCIGVITDIPSPTVCTITSVGSETITYPATTPTTWTETISGYAETYCWPWTWPDWPAFTVTSSSGDPTTSPQQHNTTVTTTSTKTITVTATSTTTSEAICTATSIPLTCDKYGYLVQHAELIRIDLSTGANASVARAIGDGSDINAMGYNPLDNYLYARQGGDNRLIRIAGDGLSDVVETLPSTTGAILGDFDTEGYYWYASSSAAAWYKMDLRPGSSKYGQVVANGSSASVGRTVSDWVYVPVAGRYLWTLGTNPSGGVTLLRWALEGNEFEILREFPSVAAVFGAFYGINNGTIFGSDNTSGKIWAFDVLSNETEPYIASSGPASTSNDGARCVLNLDV